MTRPPAQSPPPVRPASWGQLGFERQEFVRWFHPVELLRAGLYALLGSLFGSFADKREIQAALNAPDVKRFRQYARAAPKGDFWFDFVADIGDGFDATYSIAYLLAQKELAVEGHPGTTRRGQLLLMGGDEVYPSASRKNYVDRSIGPYRAAFPYTHDERLAPHLYAVPGNHDWYDGLSAFLRQFAQHDQRWVGGWLTQQRRSYFARELPRHYWLWGVDIQLHADIDSPQLGYFRAAAEQLAPNDRVILATAEPSWVKEAEGDHAGYQSLSCLMREVTARGARVVLVVTGDSHHYAHYVDAQADGNETHFITAGGGGAFLHGTHTLPQQIFLPQSADPAEQSSRRELQQIQAFPTPDVSRQLIRQRIAGFPFTNRAFALVWLLLWLWLGLLLWAGDTTRAQGSGIVQLLAASLTRAALAPHAELLSALAIAFGLGLVVRVLAGPAAPEQRPRRSERPSANEAGGSSIGWRTITDVGLWLAVVAALGIVAAAGEVSPLGVLKASLSRNLSAAMIVALVPIAGAVYVSRPLLWAWAWAGRFFFGLLHGSLYVLSWLLLATLVAQLSQALGWGDALWLLGTPVAAAAASTLLFAGSLWFGGQYQRALLNDAFSAIGVEEYKNFLRFKIGSGGELTIHAIGLRDIVRRWRLNPQGGPTEPHIIPEDGEALTPHLIEHIVIQAPPPTTTTERHAPEEALVEA
jgi:hypothetical protein